MLQQVNQTEARDLEWSCQAVSSMDEPCGSSATFHCGICGRWFCAVHAQDEAWHTCALALTSKSLSAISPMLWARCGTIGLPRRQHARQIFKIG